MSHWLAPLRQYLLDCSGPVRWFFRDDDAGWGDPRLLALVDVFRAADGHVDLAAIPAATSPVLGRRLSRLIDEGCVSVHQHGWAHVNHELRGRKCEFGPSRSAAAQRRDIVDGRDVLAERLDGRLEPVFTPPWNRCTDSTAGVLVELGFRGLSADCSAPRRDRPGLIEIPVSLDWTRSWSRGGRRALAEDLHDLTRRLPGEPGPPVIGVMLHHAVMTVYELRALREMLALLRVADAAAVTSIGALLRERTFTLVSSTGHGPGAR
jgi:hypothetical protein